METVLDIDSKRWTILKRYISKAIYAIWAGLAKLDDYHISNKLVLFIN